MARPRRLIHTKDPTNSSSGNKLTMTPRADTPAPVVPVTCTWWSWSWAASWLSGMAVGTCEVYRCPPARVPLT